MAEDSREMLSVAALSERLIEGFSPAAARDFDGTVRLLLQPSGEAPAQAVAFRIDHGRITACDPQVVADITLYFSSAAQADALLRGAENPVGAFMEGRFRSDGYLLWVFAVLAMFRAA